ncbi:Trypsin-like peptidase domain-containing protein [Micromonospora purpureochromogenes]|uniref:Trypsin-like peptidase domain-containing protein n=1 Tax=Micromonospora purpureochromogenes TaxID=47872 RepID=A0A1C5A6K5_9ACTN|nr:trypsin-like peptidase domain-containing protein [Micromonospora purpureochromogenes]SCF40835.1 Trypsin-like peptidase domain-containing protein [Micromonospora purpureochromogenes]
MQPDGPYRFTEVMGVCQVGRAWWAVDGQDRLVTVAVLEPVVAEDPAWRRAFSGMADALAAPGGGGRPYLAADFTAAAPWVAYAADGGPGADYLFLALGHEIRSERPDDDGTVAMLQVPPADQSQPAPWAIQGDPTQARSVSAPPQQVSSPPDQAFAPPQPVSVPPHQTNSPPHQVSVPPHQVSVPPYQVSSPPEQVSTPPAFPHPDQPVSVPPQDPFAAPARRIQPSAPPRRQPGLWAALAALLLVAVVGGGVGLWAISADHSAEPEATPTVPSTAFPSATPVNPGLKPWAQAALRSPEERALATVGPSMVFVEVIFTGYVRNKQDNALLRKTPITFNRRCTGFVVNHDGHVLTNSQCVRPTQDIVLNNALGALGNALVAEGGLNAKDVPAFIRARMRTAVFTGIEPGAQPDAKLYGQLNVAKGDVTDSPAIPGAVVQSLALEAGNIALVKLAQENLPAAELNTAPAVAQDTSLLILGYTTTDTSYRTASYNVLSKSVTVTGVDTQSPVNPYRINEDLGIYSRGGIAIDPAGRVVGMLDNDLLRPDKANRVVVPVSTMTGLLAGAGIQNSLGEPDKLYRSGLDAYFAGQNATAVDRFDAVVEGSPTNLLARSYRQAAVDSGGGEDSSGRPGWAVPLLAGSGGALAVGLVVLLVMLARRRDRTA